jgi:hypothetical protein
VRHAEQLPDRATCHGNAGHELCPLSEPSHAAIERAIVGLPHASESERDLRLGLAGYLAPASGVTEEARELRREAKDRNAVRKSEPLFGIESWGGWVPSLSEQLEESGVDTGASCALQLAETPPCA